MSELLVRIQEHVQHLLLRQITIVLAVAVLPEQHTLLLPALQTVRLQVIIVADHHLLPALREVAAIRPVEVAEVEAAAVVAQEAAVALQPVVVAEGKMY